MKELDYQSNKKILYPYLSQCAQQTDDPYWQHVFEDCARGRFPRGSGIDTTSEIDIYVKNTKVCEWYKLSQNCEKDFLELKSLFQSILHLGSTTDRKEIKDEIDTLKKKIDLNYNGDWKDIRKKNIRENIIKSYILKLKKIYNLNHQETAQLLKTLNLGFLFNWIDNDNVVYENKHVTNIKNLSFDDENRLFEIDDVYPSSETEIIDNREYKPKISKLSAIWKKTNSVPRNCYSI